MNMMPSQFDTTDTPLVEVLTNDTGEITIGYTIGGAYPGPSLLVAGHGLTASMVFDRLRKVPTIGWIRGEITLIILDQLEKDGFKTLIANGLAHRPDEIHFLSYSADPTARPDMVNGGFWSTLRICKRLGMISGRGIPRSTLEKEQ